MADVSDLLFWTEEGIPVPAVTAEQMREVDRISVEEFGLGIPQIRRQHVDEAICQISQYLEGHF